MLCTQKILIFFYALDYLLLHKLVFNEITDDLPCLDTVVRKRFKERPIFLRKPNKYSESKYWLNFFDIIVSNQQL